MPVTLPTVVIPNSPLNFAVRRLVRGETEAVVSKLNAYMTDLELWSVLSNDAFSDMQDFVLALETGLAISLPDVTVPTVLIDFSAERLTLGETTTFVTKWNQYMDELEVWSATNATAFSSVATLATALNAHVSARLTFTVPTALDFSAEALLIGDDDEFLVKMSSYMAELDTWGAATNAAFTKLKAYFDAIDADLNTVANAKTLSINHLALKAECEKRPVALRGNIATPVTTSAELAAQLGSTVAGGVITVADGTYSTWGHVDLSAVVSNGIQGSRILIQPQTPGGVTFSGNTSFKFGKSDIRLHGFKFVDNNAVGSFNASTTIEWNVLRGDIIGCTFLRCGNGAPGGPNTIMVGPAANNAEIGGNVFTDTHGRDIRIEPSPTGVHIHHNGSIGKTWAIANPSFASEHISIGQYGTATTTALIEYNYTTAGGDLEAISIQSNGNIIRYNYLDGQVGVDRNAMSVADGSDNVIYANYAANTGRGSLVFGERNKMYLNYFGINTNALLLVDEQPYVFNTVNYVQTGSIDNLIKQNIFKGPYNEFINSRCSDGAAYGNSTQKPVGNVITDNYRDGEGSLYVRFEGAGKGGPYTQAQFYAANTVDADLTPSIVDLTTFVDGYSMPFWWSLEDASLDSIVLNNTASSFTTPSLIQPSGSVQAGFNIQWADINAPTTRNYGIDIDGTASSGTLGNTVRQYTLPPVSVGQHTIRLRYFPAGSTTFLSVSMTITVSQTASVSHGGPALQSSLNPPGDGIPSSPGFNNPVAVSNGTQIRMITQPSGFPAGYQNSNPVHQYGNQDAYSTDGQRLSIQQNSVNAITGAPGNNFPFASPSLFGTNSTNPRYYGFANGGQVFGSTDTTGGGYVPHRNLAANGFSGQCYIGSSEGNMSRDDRYVLVNDSSKFAVLDIVSNTITNQINLPTNWNWGTISPSGSYICIGQHNYGVDAGFRRIWVMERNGTTLENGRCIHQGEEHATMVQDASGDDWVVMIGSPIVAIRLRDKAHVEFNQSRFGNVGKAAGLPGWFGMSTEGTSGVIAMCKLEINTSVPAFSRTISGLSDGRNMFPTTSITYNVYQNIANCWQVLGRHWDTSNTANVNACPSWNGNRVLFSSNLQGQYSRRDWEYIIA